MKKKFSVARGTNDILPEEVSRWQTLEKKAHEIFRIYGYKEIRTPIFEETALFARSLGPTSDVVQKQMLTLAKSGQGDEEDKNIFSLRPEGTASIVRSYIENSVDKKESLTKLYYIGAMFRGERPQKGRLRQFHQIGVEAIGPGSSNSYLDAEVITLAVRLLSEAGIKTFKLKINSLGAPGDKEIFAGILREKLKSHLNHLCEDCKDRFERNIFRILDCKNKECEKVVEHLDLGQSHLSQESQKYFKEVQQALKVLKIPFEVSPLLVRGLDYYTHTVFEISGEGLGSQDALGAGGRYNQLVHELGGDEKGTIGAVGFALGMERILMATGERTTNNERRTTNLDVFIVSLDAVGEKKAYEAAFKLLNDLRAGDVAADMSYAQGSMKSQMRLADKTGSRYCLIIGEDELKEGAYTLKDMRSGDQKKVKLENIIKTIKG